MSIKTKLHNLYKFIIVTCKLFFIGCLIILLYIRNKFYEIIHLFTNTSTENSNYDTE